MINILEGPKNFIRLPRQNRLNDFVIHPQMNQVLAASDKNLLRFDFDKKIKISEENASAQLCQFWDNNYVYTDDNIIVNNQYKNYCHLDTITQIQCDLNKLSITSGKDYLLFITDLTKNQTLASLEYHSQGISKFFWRNSLVVSGDMIGQIAFWDINKTKVIYSHTLYENCSINAIQPYSDYAKYNVFCFGASNNQNLTFMDMRTNKIIKAFNTGDAYIDCLTINQSGFVIAGSLKNKIHIIDICSGFKKISLFRTQTPVNAVQCFENLFFTGNEDGNIGLFNIDTNENVYAFGAAQKGNIKKLRLNYLKTKLIGMGSEPMIYILQF